MKTMYRTFINGVQPVTVTHETEHYVTVLWPSGVERKEKKQSSYQNFFETEKEAWDLLQSEYEDDVRKAELDLDDVNQRLNEFLREREEKDK